MIHHNETLQNESPHIEGPKNEGATKSFVQIDQSAAFQLLRDLDATEFKAFLFLTLRAYGWDDKARRVGDGVTRASGTFVAKGAKLSLATAERCIGRLKEKGLITKSTHSCKWGNTYHVNSLLLRRYSDEKSPPPPETKKKPPKIEVPQNEGTQKEEPKTTQLPQIDGTSPLKNMVLAPSNCGTNIDSRYLDLSLNSLLENFENYFSKIRSPLAEKKERACLAQIQERNPDVTGEELAECFKIVSETKDAKGAPILMKCLWMANGFDTILTDARQRIHARKRRKEELQRAEERAKEDTALEKQTSPEEVERAKDAIRAILGRGLFKAQDPFQKPLPEHERRAFLLAQARQLEQIGKFRNL